MGMKNSHAKVFLHTPACYGFTIIAKVIPGREPVSYELLKDIEKAVSILDRMQ